MHRKDRCKQNQFNPGVCIWWIIVIMITFCSFLLNAQEPDPSLTPEWAKDLIIYEISTKGFTSPNGPETGNFRSLTKKMAYLKELGINAIWLTGHSLSDPKHFYGIWTQYACIEPGKLDPSLGTEQDFKDMIAEARRHGVRVFLDTIEHGVMKYSPLIEKHPDWFKGGSWGMADYDWEGDHPDLEEWWVNMWTKAVLEWGVDGFRCDCGLHRPDLWLEIKKRCATAGKSIFVLGESGIENVSDACQRDILLFNQRQGRLDNHAVFNNLAGLKDLYHKNFTPASTMFQCEMVYENDSRVFDNAHDGPLSIKFLGLGEDVIGTWETELDGRKDWTWLIEGVDINQPIKNIRVKCPQRSWHWQLNGFGWKLAVLSRQNGIKVSGGDPLPGPKLRVISPSCHDCGWDGFPVDKNPYMVQGSRFVFGYGVLFAPAIPIFMSGEEFNADYKPLPDLTPDLYGKGKAGAGRWLYGSWLQWDQLEVDHHREMLTDVRRMLKLRREHQDLIHAVDMDNVDIVLNEVEISSKTKLPIPYIISNGKRALLVAGNPTENDVDVELNFTNEQLAFPSSTTNIRTTILWAEEKPSERITVKELSAFRCTVPGDCKPGGGLHIVRFERIN